MVASLSRLRRLVVSATAAGLPLLVTISHCLSFSLPSSIHPSLPPSISQSLLLCLPLCLLASLHPCLPRSSWPSFPIFLLLLSSLPSDLSCLLFSSHFFLPPSLSIPLLARSFLFLCLFVCSSLF